MGPHNAVSPFVLRGYRPLIHTLATEAPESDGDFILIMARPDGSLVLKRTRKLSAIASADDWENTAIVEQVGPDLPAGAVIVQAAGGHAAPVFYVSDSIRLWKLDPAGQTWREIVPGGPPGWTAGCSPGASSSIRSTRTSSTFSTPTASGSRSTAARAGWTTCS